jgi:integrase
LPKQVHRHPGIKPLSDGGYQARVYHHAFEESRNFTLLDDAKRWQNNLKKDLERAPEGILRQKKEWIASALGPDGVTTEAFENLDDAIQWLNQALVLLARGEQPPTFSGSVIFGACAEDWLRKNYSDDQSRKGTYASQLKIHVSPYLGEKDLRAISPSDLQDWVDELEKKGVGASTVKSSCTVVRQVLKYAIKEKQITKSPWVGIDVENSKKSKRARAFSVEELIAIAKKCGPYELFVMVLGMCGLRIGEATALRKRHLDFRKNEIIIEEAWKKTRTGKRQLGDPKNGESREVPIPPRLRDDLLELANQLDDDDFLFKGTKGGALNADFFRKNWFVPALHSLGIRNGGIHMLRHTCASLLIRLGTPITTVSQILGHSDVQITLKTYAHFYVEDSFTAMAKLSQHVDSYTE